MALYQFTYLLLISEFLQGYWPICEMGRHNAHFTKWVICLPIS